MSMKDLDSSNHLLKEWYNKYPWLSNRISYVTKIDILGSLGPPASFLCVFFPLRPRHIPPSHPLGEYPYPSWWLILPPYQESSPRKGPEISHVFAGANKLPLCYLSPGHLHHYAFSTKNKNAWSCSRLLDTSQTGFFQGTSDGFSKLAEKLYLRWAALESPAKSPTQGLLKGHHYDFYFYFSLQAQEYKRRLIIILRLWHTNILGPLLFY